MLELANIVAQFAGSIDPSIEETLVSRLEDEVNLFLAEQRYSLSSGISQLVNELRSTLRIVSGAVGEMIEVMPDHEAHDEMMGRADDAMDRAEELISEISGSIADISVHQ